MAEQRGISFMSMSGNIAENWKMWRSRFENYLRATEMNKKAEANQCAQLLHFIGEEGFRIYTTFTFGEQEVDKLSVLIKKFEDHFLPKENLSFERYKFFMYRQQAGQSLEQFVTELKKQAQKCKLGTLQDDLIKCMMVCGVQNNEMREKLLQKDDLTLDQAIELCKVIEKSKEQSKQMGNNTGMSVDVDLVRAKQATARGAVQRVTQQGKFNKSKSNSNKIISCTRCGRDHEINKCPAYGKSCNLCKNKNHFASVCKNKNRRVNEIESEINLINNQDESDYLFVGSIENNQKKECAWLTELKINNLNVSFKIDTGAMCNVLPLSQFKRLGLSNKILEKTTTKLKSYTGDCLEVIGLCRLTCFKGNKKYFLHFYVVKSNTQAILGLPSCEELNLVMKVDSLTENIEYKEMIKEFGELFRGIGCLSKPYHINLVDGAKPVIHPTREGGITPDVKIKTKFR